ncbi:SHOCT domain-containing protein [Actinoplanes sp. OR16]|uniref:SHOCT domain-containing protein n=1 Tax=Actinoplanes sp. OR16 TaxID=946334 RepID=UPI000FD8970C|nr:SHOCT domain-containing protein [Actinoplanes sp. OR16]
MFNDNGSFLLALFEFFIFCAWFMCLFWLFGDLFRSKDIGGFGKTMWVLFLIILPLVGMLVYLIARGSGMQERAIAQAADMQERQEAYIRTVAGKSEAKRTPTEEIASAKSLLDSGTISQADFERLKADALGRTATPVA